MPCFNERNVTLILVLYILSRGRRSTGTTNDFFLNFLSHPQGPLDRQGRNKPMGHLRLARSAGEGEGWDAI